MEKLQKMIETLAKFARDGKDTEQTRRLARNLGEIKFFANSPEFKKFVDAADIELVSKKQSLQSCLENSALALSRIENRRLLKNLATAPISLAEEI
ncbi:MAG: hypothetical protein EOM80_19160, partial [Erysipelotrichia bacterium]|nr:hypothetical protein [Erysipelotrichia bacterium]